MSKVLWGLRWQLQSCGCRANTASDLYQYQEDDTLSADVCRNSTNKQTISYKTPNTVPWSPWVSDRRDLERFSHFHTTLPHDRQTHHAARSLGGISHIMHVVYLTQHARQTTVNPFLPAHSCCQPCLLLASRCQDAEFQTEFWICPSDARNLYLQSDQIPSP